MNDSSMDKVFQALASPVRRRILDIVKAGPGSSVADVSGHFDVSRIAVMKHLAVLESAGLLVSEKKGRRRFLYFNAVPIQTIYERWTTEYSAHWASKMTALKMTLEDAS